MHDVQSFQAQILQRGPHRLRDAGCRRALELESEPLASAHHEQVELRTAIFNVSNAFAQGTDNGTYTITLTANIPLTQSLPMIRGAHKDTKAQRSNAKFRVFVTSCF